MSVVLLSPIVYGGSPKAVGTVISDTLAFEAGLVNRGVAKWQENNLQSLNDRRKFIGSIILAYPTTDGNSASAAQVITTQTVSGNMTGQQLLYSVVHRDDFGGAATSLLTYPGEIVVPAGVNFARFTSSLQFPPEASSGANGIRWNRIMLGPFAGPTHKGNSGARPAAADSANTMQTVTGIYEVTPGEHYLTTAIQNCGSSLTLGVGGAFNNWASNWFMGEFFI